MNALPAAPPGPSAKTGSSWSLGDIALLLGPFALVWAAYLVLRTTMADDALAPFRNGLYWPGGEALMLEKGGGIVSRILLHVAFTFGVGVLLIVGLVVIRSAVSKRVTRSRIAVFVCFALAFLLMLGVSTVPNRLTRIDPARGAFVVSHMIAVPPWTTSTEELAFEEVRALGVRLGVRGTKSKERVARIFAVPERGEPLELGEAECPGADDECLEWVDPAAAQLAKRLGWKGKPRASMADGGKLRQYEPSAAPGE